MRVRHEWFVVLVRLAEDEARRKGAEANEIAKRQARREAIERAARSFTLGELGQGCDNGGGDRMRKNRFELLESVCRLGAKLPPDDEADWLRWLRRVDEKGIKKPLKDGIDQPAPRPKMKRI